MTEPVIAPPPWDGVDRRTQSESLHVLESRVEILWDSIRTRFDDQIHQASLWHAENSRRLISIESEVKRTNGRVNKMEEQIRTLFAHIKRLAGWDKPKAEKVEKADGGLDSKFFTARDWKMLVSGGVAIIGAFKFAEWAFNILKTHP